MRMVQVCFPACHDIFVLRYCLLFRVFAGQGLRIRMLVAGLATDAEKQDLEFCRFDFREVPGQCHSGMRAGNGSCLLALVS